MPDAVLIAVATMIAELSKAYVATLQATPPADQKALWDWYVADMTKIRTFFKMPV
jgi:hypothetical protein